MAKSQEKQKAIELRQMGNSIKSIASELNVSVGSVSIWCRDVKLTKKQLKKLEENYRDPNYGRRLQNSLVQRQKRIYKEEKLREEGVVEVGDLSKRELFLVGIALYWAEGFKKDSQVGLGSSDPKMMKLYIKWLSECFGYDLDDLLFRVTFNESHGYREKEIIKFWADQFKIDVNIFQKPFYQKVKWKKVYSNPENYYGVLRIRVRRSKDLLRKIYGYIDGLSLNV